MPYIIRTWEEKTVINSAISSGLRNSSLSAFASRNYDERSHHDPGETGPTIGLRCSNPDPINSHKAHVFVYPQMSCEGKQGVLIQQPIGTLTVWFASLFEHTSSVDEERILHGGKDTGTPSVGIVAVQKNKLLSVPNNRKDVMDQLVFFPGQLTYQGLD